MGACSTIRVARRRAIEEMFKHLHGDIDNQQLEEFLDNLLRERLYNAIVVDDDAENEDSLLD